nr:MAG TPA_asm: hypothetical protein [Caudoviricetes sp.]DAM58737.1 MAG TPA: hypothetical protein [Caudoviricetes sp.]
MGVGGGEDNLLPYTLLGGPAEGWRVVWWVILPPLLFVFTDYSFRRA